MKIDRRLPRWHGPASAALLAAMLSFPAGNPAQAGAQQRGPAAGDTVRASRTVDISPRSGPPGTAVTIRPHHMPGVTPVVISFGGTRSGFEELAQTVTDVEGDLVGPTTFVVPEWAVHDRNYAFMVMDIYFRPLALSEVFFVTGPEGTVVREGWITDEGTACTSLRGDGGELYTLAGLNGRARVGDRVTVEGTLAERSDCPGGTPLRVVRVDRRDGGASPADGETARPARAAAGSTLSPPRP